MQLDEQRLGGAEVFRGRFLRVNRDEVSLPDGTHASREYVRHPGAVAVIALTGDGQLVLERQYRYPLSRTFIEIPAGKIDPDEAHEATARRELMEETGYSAARWVLLGTAYPCIGYSDEAIHYYLAEGLVAGERALDDGEFLEVFTLPLATVRQMAARGEICDSKTLVGLYWLDAHLAKVGRDG